MKSIMEKASTVEKAIKKAWERSQYPLSFSIKILEKPETNFLGLTKTPAKIALFYSEQDSNKETKVKSSFRKKESTASTSSVQTSQDNKRTLPSKKYSNEWTGSMVDAATLWINNVLSGLNKKDMTFRLLRKNSHLIFQFDRPFIENEEQQRLLFSSFALLLLKALRIKFKDQVKYLKVVFQLKL
jgi:hypothetical protein